MDIDWFLRTRNQILEIGWMKIYFQFNCEVMPTTGRMHLSDNYTRREVYDVYRSEMVVSSNKSVTYSQFTRLWRAWFRNVIIPRCREDFRPQAETRGRQAN